MQTSAVQSADEMLDYILSDLLLEQIAQLMSALHSGQKVGVNTLKGMLGMCFHIMFGHRTEHGFLLGVN